MTEQQSPIPNERATLERHGIRGVDGPNSVAQIAPLNDEVSSLHRKLDGNDRSNDQLRIELEVFMLEGLMASSAARIEQCDAMITTAYQRPFSEWLALVADAYSAHDAATLQQQLANAWHNIEELLIRHPR